MKKERRNSAAMGGAQLGKPGTLIMVTPTDVVVVELLVGLVG